MAVFINNLISNLGSGIFYSAVAEEGEAIANTEPAVSGIQ